MLGRSLAIARSNFERSGANDYQAYPLTDVIPRLGRSPAIAMSDFERSGENDHQACPQLFHQTLGRSPAIARSDFERSGTNDHQAYPPTNVMPPLGHSPTIARD